MAPESPPVLGSPQKSPFDSHNLVTFISRSFGELLSSANYGCELWVFSIVHICDLLPAGAHVVVIIANKSTSVQQLWPEGLDR